MSISHLIIPIHIIKFALFYFDEKHIKY